uniref:Uncharacterized protein n=1 Tax=Sphaerodactylus townsendi TaxID=933632 RepID=A0ACB8EG11_9SAUR
MERYSGWLTAEKEEGKVSKKTILEHSFHICLPSAPGTSATKVQTTPGSVTAPGVPLSNLNVTDVSPNSLRVTWSAPPSTFHTFSLQYRDPKSSATPGEIRVPGTERSVNVMGLNPGTEYDLKLSGETPDGIHSAPVATKASTAPAAAPPEKEKPTLGSLSVSEVTDSSARLLWDIPTGNFDSFLIQYKDAEGKQRALPMDASSREATIADLVPSRKYKFNLYGLIGRKRLGPVSTEIVTAPVASEQGEKVELAALPSLGELVASEITTDSVRLSWSVPSGSFDSFVVQFKDAEGRPHSLPVEGVFREVIVPNLSPSHRYRFNLYGVANRKRLGPVTKDVVTASSPERPGEDRAVQPSLGELSTSDASSNSVRLSWTVRSGRFDSFQVQFKDAEGKPRALPVEGDSREVTVPNLSPSTRYKFNLYGVSGKQRYGPISAEALTAASVVSPEGRIPIQPSLGELSVSDVTSDSVILSWTVPTGSFDSFLVHFKDTEGKVQMLPVEGVFRTVTVPNLAPSHRYKFNLYGVSGRKRSGPISTDATTAATVTSPEVTTERVPVQPSLEQLAVSDITSDSLRLSWIVRTGNFDSFLVHYKEPEGKSQSLPVEGPFRTVTVQNLEPSQKYKFNLYGISGNKRLGPLSVDAVTGQQKLN